MTDTPSGADPLRAALELIANDRDVDTLGDARRVARAALAATEGRTASRMPRDLAPVTNAERYPEDLLAQTEAPAGLRAALERLVDSATLGHATPDCRLCADIAVAQDVLAAGEVRDERP